MSARVILDRLRRRLRRDDAGLTLAELVVAMGLSTIVGAMTLTLFVLITKSSGATVDRTVNTSAARNLIQSWTGYLRVADGTTAGSRVNRIEWLAANDMLFYADLYNRSMSSVGTTSAPTMIWLRRDSANALVEEQFPASSASGATPSICRILVGASDSTVQLFTAYDSHGAVMAAPPLDLGTAPAPTKGCQKLPVTVPSQTKNPDTSAVTNLQNVFSVVIDFIISDSRAAHRIEFRSQAVLPALGAVQ
jgi:hypothetical protein